MIPVSSTTSRACQQAGISPANSGLPEFRSPDFRGRGCRGGFSLIELVLSSVILTILMAAMTSAMLIALKALDDSNSSPIARTVKARNYIDEITSDLALATAVTSAASHSITFTVPDRTGDSQAETITYSWSSTPGDPITRTFNGTQSTFASNTHQLDFTYLLKKINTPDYDLAVSDTVVLKGSALVEAIGRDVLVSTNSTSSAKIQLMDSAVIDGNAFVGPGGNPTTGISVIHSAQITGTRSTLASSVSISTPALPSLGSSVGDRFYTSGTTTLSSNLHCNKFEITSNAVVKISGHVTILADDEVRVKDMGTLQVLSDSSLTLYAKKIVSVEANGQVNVNTANPSQLTIYVVGTDMIQMLGQGRIYANMIAPNAQLYIIDTAGFYGTFKGLNAQIESQGEFHGMTEN